MDLLVLNTDFETVAIVDTYKTLIWTDRYDECGDFEITFAMNSDLLNIFKADYYLCLNESEHCMIIEDLTIETDAEEGDTLTVVGRSLESLLDRRVVWKQKVLSGNFQNGIKTLLDEAIISPSVEERKISNFIFAESTDETITALTIEQQYMGETLYDIVKDLCQANSIGFKIVLTDDNKFEFSLYAGADRSYNQTENTYVIFSPTFENVVSTNFCITTSSYKNVCLVGGEGEGSAKKTVSVGTASGIDRREMYTDAGSVSSSTEGGTISDSEYTAQLQAKGTEALAEYEVSKAFEGEIEATLKYGKDFFIGDTVQIADEYGNESTAYISEFVISNDEDGLSFYPTFATREGQTK